MLKIKLQRVGRRHDPKFRVVVTDSRNGPKSRRNADEVGSYDAKMGNILLKEDRITYWLSVGAQPTDTVHNMLVDAKIIKGSKRNSLPKKTPIVSDESQEEAKETPKEEAPAAPEAETEEAPAAEEKAETTEESAEEKSEEVPAA